MIKYHQLFDLLIFSNLVTLLRKYIK